MSDNRFYTVPPKGRPVRIGSAEEALAARAKGKIVWFDYFNPERSDLETLAGPLELDPLSVEDCFDHQAVPKIDNLSGYTFVLFNAMRYEAGEVTVEEVDLFLGRDFVVSVHRSEREAQPLSARTEERVAQDPAKGHKKADHVLHAILDFLVDRKILAIEALQEDLEAAEDAILGDLGSFRPDDLMKLRRSLLTVRKTLFHEREVLTKICRRDSQYVDERSIFAFRDVQDHLTGFFEIAEICREMVSGQMETYLSMLNNRMALAAQRTNRSVQRLTFITTIFMPLTLIAGIGGMSEWSMMTGPENWPISYPAFLLLMAVVGGTNWWVLRFLQALDEADPVPSLPVSLDGRR